MKNVSFVIILNAEGSSSLQVNRYEVPLDTICIPKRSFSLSGGLLAEFFREVLKHEQNVNSDLYCEQLDLVNKSLIENFQVIVNIKCVILQHDKQDHTAQYDP